MLAKTISNGIAILLLTFLAVNNSLATNSFVVSTDTTYINLEVCEEECPLPNGLPCEAGTYVQTLVGSDGCDSLIITTLNIIDQLNYQTTICEGDSIYISEIDSFFTPLFTGGYSFEWNGCLEGILFSVFVEYDYSGSIYASTCNPGDCFELLGIIVCPKNDTMFSIPSGYCGEVDVFIEVFGPTPMDSFIFYSCPEECIVFDGGTFCNDFSSTTIVPTWNGCDSIVYFEANFYDGSPDPIRLAYCEGECAFWEGIEYCSPISLVDSFISSNGCDSIVLLSVEEMPFKPNLLPEDTIIELGAQLTFEVDFDNFTVFWNTGVDSSIFVFEATEFGPGVHPVFATIVNNDTGCLRLTDTTMVQVGAVTGLDNSKKLEELIIYPNPVQQDHRLTLEIPTTFSNENISIKWFDRLGQILFSQSATTNQEKVILEKHGGLSSGVYFVEISVGAFSAVRRVVVF